MKRFLLLAGVASLLCGQAASGYVNQGVVQNPNYVIDDPVFVNDSGAEFYVYNDFLNLLLPYRTHNTLSYTNYGLMESLLGFEFDRYSVPGGLTRWADSFHNDTFGAVNSGTSSNGFILYSTFSFDPDFPTPMTIVGATNVVNRGTLSVAPEGIISVVGKNVDLSRGRIYVAAYEYSPYSFYAFGQLDSYWGGRDVEFNPAVRFGGLYGTTPRHWVTNRTYLAMETSLFGEPYVNVVTSDATSNVVVNVAFINNGNLGAFTITPYAYGSDMYVEWAWTKADPITGASTPAYLYLQDILTSVSNVVMVTNGYGPPRVAFRPTFIPTNYYFYSSTAPYAFGTAMSPGSTTGLFPSTNMTREFSAYEIQFSPTMSLVEDYAHRSYTNMPGRVQLIADGPGSSLNLERARIYGVNSLVVKATNHFAGAAGAKIVAPFGDLDLGTTNGSLSVSNLLAPVVPRLEGYVSLWSTAFTNVDSRNYTNAYHVLFVDSQLMPTVPARMQNVTLRGSNVFVSDVLNILSNLTLRAQAVTITSNAPGVEPRTGQLNLLSAQVFGPSSSPGLLNLTNYGGIFSYNLMYFTNQSRPYRAFVNHGSVTNGGSKIAADYFENRGIFYASGSLIDLVSPNAVLRDGAFAAPPGDITLRCGDLTISNHTLLSGRALNLSVTGTLDDGTLNRDVFTVTNKNIWYASAGFNLPVKPAQSSLQGTTIHSTAPFDSEVTTRWAASDLGNSTAGFDNNAALGRLVLDASTNSNFRFTGTGTANALYVDRIELVNQATNIDNNGNFTALVVDANMKIYYGEAVVRGLTNQFSVAERMNGRNGGRLQWVSSRAGFFSSTNVLYPNGTINRLNSALVSSCNLDSNNNGLANCVDPAPVWVASQDDLRAVLSGTPPAVVLTWRSPGSAVNSVYAAADIASPAWELVTQFVSPSVIGTALTNRYVPAVGTDSRFYRVRVDVP